ncbi:MAG TPA: RNA polymerase sigma factor [Steroidobacteraceae bacterium]|jgi:RNA polymerase sigma-70 factor (ECF subfamily)|nr:RNA polymerase sigma factor [Steroidobacteraceae bacterium]
MQPAPADAAAQDRDIVALLQSGALEPAFQLTLARYQDKVYRLCCAVLRDPSAAEDAAQESLVRIWKAIGSYDGRASLSTWIYTITRNRCLSAIERRRELASLSDEAVAAEAEAQADSYGVTDAEPQEGSALLREMVDLLPERYRRTLTLFYYEDRSVSEVASMLGMPEGTVKTNLSRARAALTEQLRRRGLADPRHWLETSP